MVSPKLVIESLMKSKKKLPKLLWSKYGASIFLITNIDHSKEYQLITHTDYINLTKRKNAEKFLGRYAILYPDNHLRIPDSEIKSVNVLVYSLDEKSDDISDCADCKECKSYWDTEVQISDKMREVVIQETLKEISLRLQIPKDENDNLNGNEKG